MNLDVVVVTYESSEHVPACLDSAPPGATTVVVDNASTDASAALAEESGALVIRNPTNRGFAAAANQGAAAGAGDLILFLNPDARIDGTGLDRLVGAVRSDPAVAVAGPRLVHPDGSEQRPGWPFPSARRSWLEALGLLRLRPERDRTTVDFVVGACFLIRRQVFEALGGFDEAFWLYGEEADLCRRVVTAGWKVRLVAEAVAIHVGGASAEAAGAPMVSEQFCLGTDRFVLKHGGRAALVSHRLGLLTGSALRVAALSARPGHPTAVERRSLVRRQLRVLATTPASLPVTATATAEEPDGIVVCSLEAWDDTWRRNQFFVRELMARDPRLRVLFVEPAADVTHELIRSRCLPRRIGLRRVTPDEQLWALRPRKILPRTAGRWADESLVRQVREAASVLGMKHPTLWVNDSVYADLPRVTGWPTLYDITDDWLEAPSTPRENRRRRRREQAMLARSAMVTVCSPALAADRGKSRPVQLIPNAVDADHLRRPRPRPADLPAAPCAVYVGTLHESRLDVDLVVELARSLPDARVVLVGPDAMGAESRARMSAQGNVHLLGARPYEDVPGYLQHADVVVVPHVVTPFTESLDPIKAYEILAVGRPAVTTPVAGLRDLGPPVRSVTAAGFVEAVRQVLADRPPSQPQDVARWAERAVEFESALREARSPRPIAVVYVDHCAQLSGGELALLRLLPSLDGVAAHVILAEDGPLRPRLEQAGISCEVLPMSLRARDVRRSEVAPGRLPFGAVVDTARYTLQLRARLREIAPDLAHTNSLKSGVYGSIAARLAGIPVVSHVRDRIAADYLPRPAVMALRPLIRHLPQAVVANSAATLDCLGRPWARQRSVISSPVIHDSVPAFLAAAMPRRASRSFTVGMIGRIAPWKGQDVFLRAFARAFPDGDEVARITGSAMFGEEAYLDKIRDLADELGLEHRIEFVGFVDDVALELTQLDVAVHASVIPEPFGQVVVEAMAAGVPVIAAAAGGPLEIIEDQRSGLLHPPGDEVALSAALRRVRDEAGLRSRLAAGGLVRAQDFSPESVAAKTLRVYRAVLDSQMTTGGDTA